MLQHNQKAKLTSLDWGRNEMADILKTSFYDLFSDIKIVF